MKCASCNSWECQLFRCDDCSFGIDRRCAALPNTTQHCCEATSSRKNRSLGIELATAAVASVFLGFGSLFLLLASGVYV
ncbi:hypothetical protein F2Q70_00034325 [Brassica cretica]|uniref:Dolichyl-diphosphooligosaccharide-protein glycosyltransferase subunit OST5 n=1 Tax=Brassica cretica TaxID=69181 RepID=A0A8S9JSH7_BRACR|nr:hypothetical protein F2Q70_00034325 [Brassica cretica]